MYDNRELQLIAVAMVTCRYPSDDSTPKESESSDWELVSTTPKESESSEWELVSTTLKESESSDWELVTTKF